MVDLKKLRILSLDKIGSREAELCLKRIGCGLSSDEQLEFVLLGRVKREKHLEAVC